jgi:DNA repair protein RAD5
MESLLCTEIDSMHDRERSKKKRHVYDVDGGYEFSPSKRTQVRVSSAWKLFSSLDNDSIGETQDSKSEGSSCTVEDYTRKGLLELKLRVSLLDHQISAAEWWYTKERYVQRGDESSTGGILADEMGLGKTLTAIASSLLCDRMDEQPTTPTLIVAPKSVLIQWVNEIVHKTSLQRWDVYSFFGKKKRVSREFLLEKTFVLTTYDTVLMEDRFRSGQSSLFTVEWKRVILDEAHKIKNGKNGKTHRATKRLRSKRRWCLTGTPMGNALTDIQALCKFIGIHPYDKDAWWEKRDLEQVAAWKKTYLLNRTKKSVPLDLHPPTDEYVVVLLSDEEREFYDRLATDAEADFGNYITVAGVEKCKKFNQILVWLLRLRQCCCDPLLLLGRSTTIAYVRQARDSYNTKKRSEFCALCEKESPICGNGRTSSRVHRLPCNHIVCAKCKENISHCPICDYRTHFEEQQRSSTPSSKTKKLLSILETILRRDGNQKVVIFSQWASYLDLIEIAVKRHFGNAYCRLDGDVSQVCDRDVIVQTFHRDHTKRILLCTLGTGGLGLNLTCANHVILMDQWYNPTVEDQAVQRVHRIGQRRSVHIYRLMTDTEVERVVARLQQSKRRQVKWVIEGDADDLRRGITDKDVKSVFAELIRNRKE